MRSALSPVLLLGILCGGSASAADDGWLPVVRLVGWSTVQRVDERPLDGDGRRHLTPLDRGIALHLNWSLGGASIEPPRDGCPVDRPHRVPEPDPDAIPERPDVELDPRFEPHVDPHFGPRVDPRFGPFSGPSVDGCGAAQGPPGRPPPLDPRVLRRRAQAVQRAQHALDAARETTARRRARLDLHEARVMLALARSASAAMLEGSP